jgi:hypothetical protein
MALESDFAVLTPHALLTRSHCFEGTIINITYNGACLPVALEKSLESGEAV